MDPEIIKLSEVSQTNIIRITYMWNPIKIIETHKTERLTDLKVNLMVTKGKCAGWR